MRVRMTEQVTKPLTFIELELVENFVQVDGEFLHCWLMSRTPPEWAVIYSNLWQRAETDADMNRKVVCVPELSACQSTRGIGQNIKTKRFFLPDPGLRCDLLFSLQFRLDDSCFRWTRNFLERRKQFVQETPRRNSRDSRFRHIFRDVTTPCWILSRLRVYLRMVCFADFKLNCNDMFLWFNLRFETCKKMIIILQLQYKII